MDLPNMKVSEEGDEVVVRVWISGVEKKDMELEVSEDNFKIEVSRDCDKEIEEGGYMNKEWKSSSFRGVVSLPCKVVPILLHHSYDGKVLEVRLKEAGER